jgi:hypothetical protein
MISSDTPLHIQAESIHDTLPQFCRQFCRQNKKDCSNLFSEIKGSFETISNYFNSNFKYIENTKCTLIYEASFIEIEKNIWINDPILNLINEKFPIDFCFIMKTEKNSMYDWHVDPDRKVSINMLLTNDHFSECIFYDEGEIFVLNYQPNKFYLFNSQILHKVKNNVADEQFGKTRYLFTVHFVDEKDKLDYDIVYNWMNQNNLIVK